MPKFLVTVTVTGTVEDETLEDAENLAELIADQLYNEAHHTELVGPGLGIGVEEQA